MFDSVSFTVVVLLVVYLTCCGVTRADRVLFVAEMGKFMKPGKVVMVLAGRYAGRKAVIVKVKHDSGCFLLLSSLLALQCAFCKGLNMM